MNRKAAVAIWAEEVVIPTYLVGRPNRHPMFLEKRVYQGSSGRVYPYPVIDQITDNRVPERHRVVFLENEFLKLMVMPGFGGRIQYAYDKTNNYSFIYHNQVIKPALVGLAGPWLSGGIEFNWPQHHRPGTYCPVDYTIASNPDGSQTLWLSELEPMWHLKGTLGLTLYPGKALLEISIRLFNPTPLPQSFHLWTNPAVHVNDQYQSVFPPDVQAVYDHGKRAVSAFPIARGEYYKVDYSRGVDISWYKNLPVPTSYMAARSNYDFLGGYDHQRQAGVLHVADHHVVPGKKQWVWGCGDFGLAWHRNLTDGDGPYAELMCGVFADNQPDFSWLQPFEEKQAKQFFLPYKAIGYVRNATTEAAVSLDLAKGHARVGAYTSSVCSGATVRLSHRGKVLWEKTTDLSPENPLVAEVDLPAKLNEPDLQLSVHNAEARQLVSYRPEPKQAEAVPEPAKAIPEPAKVGTTEALYLAGLHLEQYRHATREPEDYFREALHREPEDVRNNHALGLLLLRRGQFAKAEPYLQAAIRTQTRHNPNPADGGPRYHLGVCLRYLGRLDDAYAAFYKAAWDSTWQDASFFQLAQLAALRAQPDQALEFIERSLARNVYNQKARHLKILLLRKLGRPSEATQLAQHSLARDPLDFGARNELVLLGVEGEQTKLAQLMRNNLHSYLEIAADYAHTGAYSEAIALLERAVAPPSQTQSQAGLPEAPGTSSADSAGNAVAPSGTRLYRRLAIGAPSNLSSPERAAGHLAEVGMPNARPMVFYFLGYYASLHGNQPTARQYWKIAAKQNPERCFPNSLESILALQAALKNNPRDAHAAFYLGNLWYDKRQVTEATACWEQAHRHAPGLATVHRNLALVHFNKQRKPAKALTALQRAFTLAKDDARLLFELDLLKRRARVSPQKRLAFLQTHRSVVDQREDLLLEFVTLLNIFRQHQTALDILQARQFHPWEGGEGKVTGQYALSLVELAKQKLAIALAIPPAGAANGDGAVPSAPHAAAEALQLLERARVYPPNLGEGKLHGAQENHILYWLGVAFEQLGQHPAATRVWREAATGMKVPTPALYYNDQNPETIFYQGLALQKLDRSAAARQRFQTLLQFGKQHLNDHIVLDYFAVSLPEFLVFDDDLDLRNQVNCRYLMALGLFGLGRTAAARQQLTRVLQLDPSHLPGRMHQSLFDGGLLASRKASSPGPRAHPPRRLPSALKRRLANRASPVDQAVVSRPLPGLADRPALVPKSANGSS